MCRADLAAFVVSRVYRAGYRTVHLLANWACVVLIVLALSAMHQLCMCLCVCLWVFICKFSFKFADVCIEVDVCRCCAHASMAATQHNAWYASVSVCVSCAQSGFCECCVRIACAFAMLSLFCFCCCVVGVSIMSCFLIGAGVAWFPGAVRPSPAAKARKQVVKINQGGQGSGNPKFSQNIMLGIYGQFLSMS